MIFMHAFLAFERVIRILISFIVGFAYTLNRSMLILNSNKVVVEFLSRGWSEQYLFMR